MISSNVKKIGRKTEYAVDENFVFFSGALVDEADAYSAAFYFAGAAIALSGVVCMPLYVIRRWKSKRCHEYDISGSGA